MAPAAFLRKPDTAGLVERFRRLAIQRQEQAALRATARGARMAVTQLRTGMQAAGLGRLGNALGNTSDLESGRGVKRTGGGGFSASGVVYMRAGSPRSRGAIVSYTEGAEIVPVRARWLWVPSADILRIAGVGKARQRVTPGNWAKLGLDRKIGPLVPIKGHDGLPLLIVRNVGVAETGARRSARALTRRGLPRKGQVRREFIVAFKAIPRTSRAARVDAMALMRQIQQQLPALYAAEMGRG